MNRKPHTIYHLHRQALSLLLAPSPLDALAAQKNNITGTNEHEFINFLLQNGLGPYFHEILATNDSLDILSDGSLHKLKNTSLYTTAQYLRQRHGLNKVEEAFSAGTIPHAIFKGAHTRELIYDNPAVRPACDIDILVSPSNKEDAVKALVAAGFDLYPGSGNISHEVSLSTGNVNIDLHWDILRPGRTRIQMTDTLLATRQQFPDHWGLNDEATLFLMLVHPVFSEYATTPYSSLMRVVDMVKWLELRKPDWEKVVFLLEQAGLKTAAWVMLAWLQMITECPVPQSVYTRLKPGTLKTKYLQNWINKDYSTRLRNNPLVVQALLTLPVHDRASDALRAVRSLIREKRAAEQNTKNLLKAVTDQ